MGAFTQMIMGYVYPGKPLANATFEAYAMMCVDCGLTAISSFKLGLYMKIPPKAMFLSQVREIQAMHDLVDITNFLESFKVFA